MKKWIIALCAVCLLALLNGGVYALGSNFGYQSGYSQGKQSGQRAGYSQGNIAGYSKGKSDGYSAGFAANDNSGYSSGYSQGQTDELGQLLDWQTNTCTLYSNGYYQFKLWRGYDGTIKYTCLVGYR